MKILSTLYWMAAILLWTTTANAQQIKATAALDSASILIGDQVTLSLELEKPDYLSMQFPDVAASMPEYIEILRQSPVDTLHLADNVIRLVQRTLITSFDSGQYILPQFWFRIDFGDRIDSIPSNELILKVYSFEIDTTRGPTDIKMPYGAPVTLKEATPWILAAFLLMTLLFFGWYYYTRRKKKLPLFQLPVKPTEPPHIIALRALDRVKEEKLWQKDKIKVYYSEVADILRTYIEERYGVQAMEYTSDETLRALKSGAFINEKSMVHLGQILSLADLVKFAKYQPLPDEHNMLLVNAYFFINDTKPSESATPAKGSGDEGKEVEL